MPESNIKKIVQPIFTVVNTFNGGQLMSWEDFLESHQFVDSTTYDAITDNYIYIQVSRLLTSDALSASYKFGIPCDNDVQYQNAIKYGLITKSSSCGGQYWNYAMSGGESYTLKKTVIDTMRTNMDLALKSGIDDMPIGTLLAAGEIQDKDVLDNGIGYSVIDGHRFLDIFAIGESYVCSSCGAVSTQKVGKHTSKHFESLACRNAAHIKALKNIGYSIIPKRSYVKVLRRFDHRLDLRETMYITQYMSDAIKMWESKADATKIKNRRMALADWLNLLGGQSYNGIVMASDKCCVPECGTSLTFQSEYALVITSAGRTGFCKTHGDKFVKAISSI